MKKNIISTDSLPTINKQEFDRRRRKLMSYLAEVLLLYLLPQPLYVVEILNLSLDKTVIFII